MITFQTGRRGGAIAALAAMLSAITPAMAQEFPFGMDFTLDAAPMRGSKRIPHLEIGENGTVQLLLWCKSATGQFSVANDTVIFVPGTVQDDNCPADRAAADDNLLAALADIQTWKRQGDRLILNGKQSLRFLSLTN